MKHTHEAVRQVKVVPCCKIHPEVKQIVIARCPACMGAANKGITSERKAQASANNGRLGGRPKLAPHRKSCKRIALQGPDPACAGCDARLPKSD